MNYKFCNFSDKEKKGLKEILSTSFEIKDYDKIFEVYEVFSNNFYGLTQPTKIESIERTKLFPKTRQKDFLSKFTDLNYQIGIDLPVLINPLQRSKKTIFIVAEDPLRSFEYPQKDVIFSTPFGTHIENCRTNNLRVYWDIIQNILNNDYNVYLTDIFKVWIKRKDSRKEFIKGDLFENFRSSLEQEIDAFSPQLIITYGKPASLLINRMNLSSNIKTISFAHPAPTANGSWKKILTSHYKDNTIQCTADNKINYINSQIKNTTQH